jgi:signal transduction histidine kinase/ActR/RegA family two-component response regulator
MLAMLLANTYLSYQNLKTVTRDARLVSRTDRILLDFERLLSALTEAETGERGFLLTDNPRYLAPYNSALVEVDEQIEDLRKLTEDDASKQEVVSVLQHTVRNKFDELGRAIELKKQGESQAALAIVESETGKKQMDEIRQIVNELVQAESDLRARHVAESTASERQARLTLILVGGSAIIMFIIFFVLISRGMKERARLLDEEQSSHRRAEAAFRAEQEARSEAERASHIKDEFLATVSHELRTPLTSMIGWSRMLREGGMDELRTAHALETIERNARSQAQLVEDLLDISRIVTGKVRLDVRLVPLPPVIEAAVESLRPAADAKKIQLEIVLDPNANPVSGDPERLKQVMWNLLSNAIKFTPERGLVRVALMRINSHIEISVTDTGRGISPSFLPHIFQRFRQADATSTREIGGLGLGLALSRHFIEMHGGTIQVESPGEGKGSVFTIRLPVMPTLSALKEAGPSHSITASTFSALDLPPLDNVRVLAVDDEPDTLNMLATLLSQRRAQVRTVASAKGALSMMESWRPDLILADIGMPGEDGYSLITKIRALNREQGGETPAIALTAYARVEDRMRTLAAGFQMHVAKPVDPSELITIVASLARRTSPS